MPDMDGFSHMQLQRRLLPARHRADRHLAQAAGAAGAKDSLSRPFDLLRSRPIHNIGGAVVSQSER
jgi:hypothetical protein